MSGPAPGVTPAPADTAAELGDPNATAARLLGQDLTQEEIAEATAYDDLRAVLLAARDDADRSQTEIAEKMAIKQSEVSRLETTVGPGTRIGRLKKYLEACDARLSVVVHTAQGRQLPWGAPLGAEPAVALGEAYMAATPAAELQMLDDILALDASLGAAGIAAGDAVRIRHAFLTQLQASRRQQFAMMGGGADPAVVAAEAACRIWVGQHYPQVQVGLPGAHAWQPAAPADTALAAVGKTRR
jgi:hypothetical protein